jgi:hypothetical protein
MKSLFIFALLVVTWTTTFGQSNKAVCKCPITIYAGTKADTTFHLSNNVSIALCGYRETEAIKGKALFSEFVLSVCGSNKIIKFWGAVELCNVKVVKDTLFVETLIDLPTGKKMSYEKTIWTIERIYFVKGKTKTASTINPRMPKYNSDQIPYVLKLYDHTKDQNSEKTGELIDKLFIATISGSNKAKDLLVNFHKKFTKLDGVYFEQYDDAIRMLSLWDKNKDHKVFDLK